MKTLELLKNMETQIIEFSQINCNTTMLMNIGRCIKDIEKINSYKVNLSPYNSIEVYYAKDIDEIIKG